jgi:hypothetical protein
MQRREEEMEPLEPGTYRFIGDLAPWDTVDVSDGFATFHDSDDGYTSEWTTNVSDTWIADMLTWIDMGLVVKEESP